MAEQHERPRKRVHRLAARTQEEAQAMFDHAKKNLPDVEFKVVKVPALDTGIGREAGYADDAAFVEAASREREARLGGLTDEVRALVEDAEAAVEREVLGLPEVP